MRREEEKVQELEEQQDHQEEKKEGEIQELAGAAEAAGGAGAGGNGEARTDLSVSGGSRDYSMGMAEQEAMGSSPASGEQLNLTAPVILRTVSKPPACCRAQQGEQIAVFLLSGLCEIGGGWMVWNSIRWRVHSGCKFPLTWRAREGKPVWHGILGGVV